MILTLYDKTHNYVGSIVKKNDLKIESQLDNGDKTLSFVYMDESMDVTPECYIRDGQDEYVVKEIARTTTGFPVIYAALNLEELEGKAWKTFQAEDCTISEAAQLAIAGTGWTVAGSDVSKKRNAGIVKKSALGVLQDLCTAFMCEMSFDTINKTITFHAQRGSDRGVYFLAGLNLLQLTKKSDSYDFYTRIVPYGADGLDIKEVNSGQEYLDNNQYSGKVRTYIWEDTNYTDAQALKDDAAAKLADMSKPKVSYSAQVIDLAEMSTDYSLLDYSLGDTVTLIDKNTGTRDKQRIVRLTEYPEEPDRNTCEMSNTFLTWEEMQAKLQASAAIVDALIGSDGNYNGTIKVSDILHFTDGVVGTSSGSNVTLGNFFQTTTGAIGALDLEVGRISANMLTAETADLRYANITFGNLDTANINTAKVKDLFVEVGLIKDAVISGAKITGYLDAVEVNAANITAGTLIADRIAIRGSTTSLVYALNNYGQIVSQQTNTLDGYILTERTINANKIVANSITGREIAADTITAFNIVGSSLSAIYADLGEITAGVLKSADYQYSSGNYSTTGMMIDLNNKIIRSTKTAILADGSIYAAEATISGKFTSTNGRESCVMDSDALGAFVSAGNAVTSIRISANSDGSVGIYEVDPLPGGGESTLALWERTGSGLYTPLGISVGFSGSGVLENAGIHLEDDGYITFYQPRDHALLVNTYNDTDYNLIRNHNNGNISVSASSGGLYLGYENTTIVDFFHGKASIDSAGTIATKGSIYVGANKANPYSDVGTWVGNNGNITLVLDSTSGVGGGIYFGYKGVNTYSAGIRLGGAGAIEVLGNLVASKSSGQAGVYASNGGTSNRIFIYADASNGQAGLYSYSADNINRAILIRANNSNDITAYGVWTFNGGVKDYVLTSGGMPIACVTSNGNRLGQMSAYSSTSISVYMQNGTSGSGYARSTIAVSSSDKRMKKNIEDCNVLALPLINTIRMRQFDWISNDEHQNIGFIADELESIDSKLAVGGGYDEENRMIVKSVDTFYLLGYLVKAIQELSAEINKLKGAA